MADEPKTLKFEVERNRDKITVRLIDGDNHATFTAPAEDFMDFLNALDNAIGEAMVWTGVNG